VIIKFISFVYREYKRRSILDPKDLLVKIDRSVVNEDDDDDDVRRLRQQRDLLRQQEQLRTKSPLLNMSDDEDEANEQKLISTNDQSQTILDFRNRYQNEFDSNDAAVVPKQSNMGDSSFDMLSDSSSSTADDEANRISELYANIGGQFDGKHRIKIKGDELKIKGRPNKQRSKLMDAPFFQSTNEDNKPSTPILVNTSLNNPSGEPDLTSFDFLNDYDEKA
jgi:hypothetical protein